MGGQGDQSAAQTLSITSLSPLPCKSAWALWDTCTVTLPAAPKVVIPPSQQILSMHLLFKCLMTGDPVC